MNGEPKQLPGEVKKGYKSKPFFQLNWKKLMSMVGFISVAIAIGTGIISFIEFRRGQPSLFLSTQNLELSPIPRINLYLERLSAIEDEAYYYFFLDDVRFQLEDIDPGNSALAIEEVNRILKMVDEEIENLKGNEARIRNIVESLKEVRGDLNNPDISANISGISSSLREIEDTYSDITNQWVLDLISEVQNIAPAEFEQSLPNLRSSFDRAIDYFEQPSQNIQLIEFMETLSVEMNKDLSQGERQRISLQLAVENRSSQKNLIRGKAMITFYDHSPYNSPGRIPSISVPLEVVSDGATIIDDYDLINLQMISRDTTTLDELERNAIKAAFDSNYSYILVIEDLHGEMWHTLGRISTGFSTQPESELRLEDESLRILKRSTSQ